MCEAHLEEQPVALESVALKVCTKCHIAKPLAKFSKASAKPDGLSSHCKECHSKADKAIKEQILASQGYVCKICSADLHNKKACVDHDHIAMMIRGILCDGCNCGLGQFDDSIILLANAISYLQKYESRQCLSTPSP
jgi:Recombination endonuclease VII.